MQIFLLQITFHQFAWFSLICCYVETVSVYTCPQKGQLWYSPRSDSVLVLATNPERCWWHIDWQVINLMPMILWSQDSSTDWLLDGYVYTVLFSYEPLIYIFWGENWEKRILKNNNVQSSFPSDYRNIIFMLFIMFWACFTPL